MICFSVMIITNLIVIMQAIDPYKVILKIKPLNCSEFILGGMFYNVKPYNTTYTLLSYYFHRKNKKTGR